ncbi:MAG: tRNA (guanosine(37)-N1)-methyltransferase TrmD [Deltaproteobacteria bacterium]|nr:tRNA (guanosine(37)-N1)-methyltransferase TrmD [Deltaproteobacteria bacterium]
MIRFDILTLFPDMFQSPFASSVLKRAIDRGLIEVNIYNIRDFTADKHHVVDDSPYGGGSGMVMMAGPIVEGIEGIKSTNGSPMVILMTPQGVTFNHGEAKRLSQCGHLLFICGRYEGVDDRVRGYIDEEISIGDYILMGGELAVMVVIDAISRFVPGVLGSEASVLEESFADALLEYPQYTRPRVFRGKRVPEVLVSGDHRQITQWRRKEALKRTLIRRPDLLEKANLPEDDLTLLEEIKREEGEGSHT